MSHDDFTSAGSECSGPPRDADAPFMESGNEGCNDMIGSGHLSAVPGDARAVELLHDDSISPDEIAAARERVRARIFAEISAEGSGDAVTEAQPLPVAAGAGTIIGWRERLPARGRLARVALVAALLAAVASSGLLDAAQADAALPGTPVYALKRLEERIRLDMAGSDTQRGATLALIARHRLDEMAHEAAQGNGAEAQRLAEESDVSVRQSIELAASMTVDHQDTHTITLYLASMLKAEDDTLWQAIQQGQTQLAQTLDASAQAHYQAISADHLALPGTNGDLTPTTPATPQSQPEQPSATPTTLAALNGQRGGKAGGSGGTSGGAGANSTSGTSGTSGTRGSDGKPSHGDKGSEGPTGPTTGTHTPVVPKDESSP